jgi:hypothetical protein
MKYKFSIKGNRSYNQMILVIVVISLFLSGCQRADKKSVQPPVTNQQSTRKIEVLTDNWRFQVDIRDIGEKKGWFKDDFDRNDWAKVTVPQAWDCYETALWGYEGIGWYSVTIDPTDFIPGKRIEIIFNRVLYYSKVWINGQYIGENLGGYLPFSFDVTKYLNQDRKMNLLSEWITRRELNGCLQPDRLNGFSTAASCNR